MSVVEETFSFIKVGALGNAIVYEHKDSKENVILSNCPKVAVPDRELNTWLLGELLRTRMKRRNNT